MKHRLLRVRELLKRELGDAIQKDLVFDGVLVTVNEVDVTPDLRQGHVFIGIVGGDEQARRKAFDKLKENRGHLQKMVSKRVVLKFMPHLNFKIDDSVERGVKLVNLMEGLPEPAPEELEASVEDDEPGNEGESS